MELKELILHFLEDEYEHELNLKDMGYIPYKVIKVLEGLGYYSIEYNDCYKGEMWYIMENDSGHRAKVFADIWDFDLKIYKDENNY